MRRFVKLAAIASACVLTLGVGTEQAGTITGPSTPGKATGGGWLNGELLLLFSADGDLLSPPAEIVSLAGGTAKSTFGFVAQCCPESGNLEYIDHGMNVRIKAQTIDGLFISSPGTDCPLIPGSRHATFTGTATVFTSTSTLKGQPFTVDVDDCGEPGSADTLGISTTGYSHVPTTLMGGNIQIHK
jgi:hypothetical protein